MNDTESALRWLLENGFARRVIATVIGAVCLGFTIGAAIGALVGLWTVRQLW